MKNYGTEVNFKAAFEVSDLMHLSWHPIKKWIHYNDINLLYRYLTKLAYSYFRNKKGILSLRQYFPGSIVVNYTATSIRQ
jgi:hypothetical protein